MYFFFEGFGEEAVNAPSIQDSSTHSSGCEAIATAFEEPRNGTLSGANPAPLPHLYTLTTSIAANNR